MCSIKHIYNLLDEISIDSWEGEFDEESGKARSFQSYDRRLPTWKHRYGTVKIYHPIFQEHLDVLTDFLDRQIEAVTEYSDTLVRRLIERITVYDKRIQIEFKSGLEIAVEG